MANVCLLTMVVIYMLCRDTRQPNKNGEYKVSVFALKRGDACGTKVNISLKTKLWPIGMHVWCCICTGSVAHSLDQLWASIHLSGIHAAIFIIIMFQILHIAVHPDAYSISESETLYHKFTDILQRSSIMWKAPVILVIFNCILSCNLNLNQHILV